ncbi:hypothetical protein L4C39_11455 [Vibrio clamense]|uniref:hypothetical protein n=1 Tax=Vibrio TaxID=662 RepID=UPI000DEA58F2|nr:hypothetical protein [Vibrio cortegadensis]MDN3697058.1 hypothetical protein [Vibrio cortegadensis]RBW64570.1 hypothetical protein DS893_12830 [Vibrionales bacterium C3R12]
MKTSTHHNSKSTVSIERPEFTLSNSTATVLFKKCQTALIVLAISIVVNLALRVDFVLLNITLAEFSVTEALQQILLLVSLLSFAHLAQKQPSLKHAALLISAFFSVLFIRELDFLFDYITHGFWAVPAIIIASSVLLYAINNGKRTLDQLAAILSSPHMNLLITGVMLLIVFSRLYGMGSFWKNIMAENYIRDVKIIAEEGTELLCYSLIAFASLKTVSGFTKKHASATSET